MKKIKLTFIFVITIFLISFVVSLIRIHSCVKSICIKAKNEYKRDCVVSLIEYIKSGNHTYREKNRAIWALGQIADKKALPFLTELNNSIPKQKKCVHDNSLCKHEIEKATKWCTKGNITKWMYRNRENW